MSDISGVNPQPQAPLTEVQKAALARLHQAATQLEGVFLEMVMNEMQDTVPKESLFGSDDTQSQETWQGMLNNERAQAIASTGSMGIAKTLEEQLKSQVLGNAGQESHVQVEGRIEP